MDHTKHRHGITDEFIKALLYTKAAEWSYEREWRVMADLVEQETNGFYYVDFGPQLKLREVILGARSTVPVGQVAKLLSKSDRPVQILKARPAFQEFAMVRNKSVKAINLR